MGAFDYDTCVGLASEAVESRELYQKVLGKMTHTLTLKHGEKAVSNFAQGIENATGYKVKPSSLRVYRWVYQKLEPMLDKIPADFSYLCWRDLAGTDDPEGWLGRAISEGMSGSQLGREIRIARGSQREAKIVVCEKCGHANKYA